MISRTISPLTVHMPRVSSAQSIQPGRTSERPQASASMMALYRTMHVRTYAARLIEGQSTMGTMRNPRASTTMALASFSPIAWVMLRGLA